MTARAISGISAAPFRIPTDAPEADGTFDWVATSLLLVRAETSGLCGLGYSYCSPAAAGVVNDELAPAIVGQDAMDVEACWWRMVERVRNAGRQGVCSMAISAVDIALWDLKARLLDVGLPELLGAVRGSVCVYGSGGFTSYSRERLQAQLAGWVSQGISMVKMKVGSAPNEDPARVRDARSAIGDAGLFVDANGAYDRKQALHLGEEFDAAGVSWFEEPVSSDDLDGLRLLRDRLPATIEVAAGEYGFEPAYFLRMATAGAVDVLQADATRCGGITGFRKVSAVCESVGMPLSTHCAPAIHTFLGCSSRPVRHAEYFHDHVQIEANVFDGLPALRDGALWPDTSKTGHGLSLRQPYAAALAT